ESLNPPSDSLSLMGDMYLRADQPAAALKAYERITAQNPDDSAAWLGEAQAASAAGDRTKALKSLDRVEQLAPMGAPELAKAGAACLRLKEYARAEKIYERLVASNPNDAGARLAGAEAAVETGDRTRAVGDLAALEPLT